jgi:hypothetical protein
MILRSPQQPEGGWLHPLQASDDPVDFAPEEWDQNGFELLMWLLGMRTISQDGDLMRIRTAVVIA